MRTGLVAKKLGMSRFFSTDGKNVPVTLLKVDLCKVIDHKVQEKHGYNALKISFSSSKKSKINKPVMGYFKKVKSEASLKTKEFKVSKEGMIKVGSTLLANHFVDGQMVDISGFTIGKGFAGGMKRHNFGGNRASHGVSISHRSHGSTGQCQDPGKVFKGKKMAGRLGNVKCTVQNLKVIQTNHEQGIIVVKGAVPGPKGVFVSIFDSVKFKNKNLPYPTFQEKINDDNNSEVKEEHKGALETANQSPVDKKNENIKVSENLNITEVQTEGNNSSRNNDQNTIQKSEGNNESTN